MAFFPPNIASWDIFWGEVGFVGDEQNSAVSVRSRLIVLHATLRYTFLLLALLYTESSSSRPCQKRKPFIQNMYMQTNQFYIQSICKYTDHNSEITTCIMKFCFSKMKSFQFVFTLLYLIATIQVLPLQIHCQLQLYL